MRKIRSMLWILIGLIFLGSALLLENRNIQSDTQAAQDSAEILQQIQSEVAEETIPPIENTPTELPLLVDNIDGYEYIGSLSIPAIDVTLPVMADWDYQRLKISPCRQFGSAQTDDLVIAAHNYKSHFGYLHRLEIGSQIEFTDVQGTTYHYVVAAIETLSPHEVDAVQNSGYPLVLYTCTPGGATRVVIFASNAV